VWRRWVQGDDRAALDRLLGELEWPGWAWWIALERAHWALCNRRLADWKGDG